MSYPNGRTDDRSVTELELIIGLVDERYAGICSMDIGETHNKSRHFTLSLRHGRNIPTVLIYSSRNFP